MQDKNELIGRKYEQEQIRQYYDSPKSELVAVYGRRRVGKTFLVKKAFGEKFDFWFTGMYEASRAIQLRQFVKALPASPGRKVPSPKDWFEAFDLLQEHLLSLGKEKVVVFLDELPWMDTQRGNFLPAFSYFWNMWSSGKTLLKLYVCGSATTWMLDKFVGDKGGLYGRVCHAIYLEPFSLGETEQFLREIKNADMSRQQVVELYMIMGGIPYYLDMIDRNLPISRNVDNLFFRNGAILRSEYEFLFRSLFRDSRLYRKVVESLAKKQKGMTREEIIADAGIPRGGNLSEILDNLCTCDFIRRYSSIGKKEKDCMYQLTDLFSLFYLRFVQKSSGQDEEFWSNMAFSGEKSAWAGYAFEQVCMHHIWQIKNRLGINGVLSNVCSWSTKAVTDPDGTEWKGGQIDLLIDRRDGVINVCKIKFVSEEFVITGTYEDTVRNRISLFKHVTGTKKAVICTFITTYGVKPNSHSGIVASEVRMSDLFRLKE